MPASGKTIEVVDEKTGKARQIKQPYFQYDDSRPVIGIAGLLSVWFSQDNGSMLTCGLMTKTASPGLMEVHDRMLVILSRSGCDVW